MWKSDAAQQAADHAYVRDYAGWVSTIHRAEAQVLNDAMRRTDDRDLRKALATRMLLIRVNALLSIGWFYIAVQRRLESSLVQARLNGTTADARDAFRQAATLNGRPFWEFLNLPNPAQLGAGVTDPTIVNEYVDSCERRATNLPRVTSLARQDMLLSTLAAGRSSRIIASTPRTLSLIKTGRESDLHELSNTAFYRTDISGGALTDASDLIAVACPTTPTVVEGIAEDIAFVDSEAGETAQLVELVADAGLLESSVEAIA